MACIERIPSLWHQLSSGWPQAWLHLLLPVSLCPPGVVLHQHTLWCSPNGREGWSHLPESGELLRAEKVFYLKFVHSFHWSPIHIPENFNRKCPSTPVWKDVPCWFCGFGNSQNITIYSWGTRIPVWEALATLHLKPLGGSCPLPICPQPNAFSHPLCGWASGGSAVSLISDLWGRALRAELSHPSSRGRPVLRLHRVPELYNSLLARFSLMTHTNCLYQVN